MDQKSSQHTATSLGDYFKEALSKPLTILLFVTLTGTLVYFYGFLNVFSKDNIHSAFTWSWKAWNPETEYEHARLIPLIILLLFWLKRKEILPTPVGSSRLGWVGLIVGALFFIIAVRTLQPRVAVGSLPFILLGASLHLWGWAVTKRLAVPILLIFLAIPVPGITQATNGLQLISTRAAYELSRAVGIDVLLSGNNLSSPDDSWGFNVAEGCSGLRSLMALTLIAAVYAYLTQKKLWKGLILFACSLPLAVVANGLRVASIVVIGEYIDGQFAGGVYHDWAGFAFFIFFGLMGLMLVDRLLNRKGKVVTRKTRKKQPPLEELPARES
ncbi:MAG: exosortase/archaeosortase family protein [Verrucomicrobiota bacterium]